MQPFIQILTLTENSSFIAETVDNNWFEIGLHQHTEYELILFTAGIGTIQIGNELMNFEPGDMFLIGSNQPHIFKKKETEILNGIVVQFNMNCLGSQFFNLPECQSLKNLLTGAVSSLQIISSMEVQLENPMKALTKISGIERIILLLQCLEIIAKKNDHIKIAIYREQNTYYKDIDYIDKIIHFTHDNFQKPLKIQQVASITCMSVPSFCYYFKHRTHKTYIDYLNEVRIDYAASLLRKTSKSVTDIGYESGFNTLAHFHRQFLKLKKTTPLRYRKTPPPQNTITIKIPAQSI
jgi:AraC-like DNA-binding protein